MAKDRIEYQDPQVAELEKRIATLENILRGARGFLHRRQRAGRATVKITTIGILLSESDGK